MSQETSRQTRRARPPDEKCRSSPKIDPLPGSLQPERRRCGKPACRCAVGELHGPYWRRYWRQDGVRRRQYVKAADAKRVREALAQWRRLHPPARSLRDELAALRRLCRHQETGGV